MSGEEEEHNSQVSTKTTLYKQTEVEEKSDVTRGVNVYNNSSPRETIVYKKSESTEKPGDTMKAQIDPNSKTMDVASNITEAGYIANSPVHNTEASDTEYNYQAREMTLLTEAHELHSYDSNEEDNTYVSHLDHDTDSEHEYLDSSDDEDQYHDDHVHSGDEERAEDTEDSEEESKLIEEKQKTITVPSSNK
ncbi:hypothetical protein GMOD_00001880 [Pyrenophora seminiperda CCB06]|uniref:Uncharacterized protein n=1 Tax=Pyrenophora seminiperda CCB06 TaxID=1302712 RepID=A0A3M7LWC7_9PLEO|nr:hypothetical protein GMOD_00001880 [Pyrenophora seminiperda CCB06]